MELRAIPRSCLFILQRLRVGTEEATAQEGTDRIHSGTGRAGSTDGGFQLGQDYAAGCAREIVLRPTERREMTMDGN